MVESTQQTPLKYFVGVDGSEASEDAFQVILKGLYREHTDKITVGHVTDRKKEYLPFNLRPDYIKQIYESKLIGIGGDGQYMFQEVDAKGTTKETLWTIAQDNYADVMVTGFHGRKGPKEDPTVAGTAVQYLAMNSILPVLIIKDKKIRKDQPNQKYNFGACYDGSEKSAKAVQTAIKMMGTKDRLYVIICEQEENLDMGETSSKAQAILAGTSAEKRHTIVKLPKEQNVSVYKTIQKFLIQQDKEKSDYIDFIAVGNKGADFSSKQSIDYLGRVANSVLKAKKMNCIFVP